MRIVYPDGRVVDGTFEEVTAYERSFGGPTKEAEPEPSPPTRGIEGLKKKLGLRSHEDKIVRGGRGQGKRLSELTGIELNWYLRRAERSLKDPAKQPYFDLNKAELEAVKAEIQFRGLGVPLTVNDKVQ